jgi:hypothetical protein
VIKGSGLKMLVYQAVGQAALDDTSWLPRPAYCARVFTFEIVDDALHLDLLLLLEVVDGGLARYRRIGVGSTIGDRFLDWPAPKDMILIYADA